MVSCPGTIRSTRSGCPPFAGMFSLGASLDLIREIGMDQIQARALQLNEYLTSSTNEREKNFCVIFACESANLQELAIISDYY